MIAVKLEGRLGNQLFQYAFIYAAAKRLNTRFYLDKSIEDFFPQKYFTIKNDPIFFLDRWLFSINGFKNIFRIHLKKAFYKTLEQTIFGEKKILIGNEQPVADELNRITNGYIYQGNFQSEKYFSDYKEDIRALFSIKKSYADLFTEINKNIPQLRKKIAVHIRRGDYMELNIAIPISYYKKVLNMISNEDATYVFISDDIQLVEKEFDYIENKYISDNNEIIDLQFLMNADVCILSNSSFSWWGAWLNQNPDKIIFAPKRWIGFNMDKEYPVGISDNLDINWITV
ncbi:MAG TPA: alpha-1,2-fucosyltransferase [Mucilaginibacter sp.]|jgi:hypothetical protein|nr:alpha-1,2-fucosyltransferase [Mucilaginibacter sp.]